MQTITFIGLGEAASAIIAGWGAARAAQITAYDIKSDDPATQDEITERADTLGITRVRSTADAVKSADMVFCAVTADQAVEAAEAAASHLRSGTFWCDLNSSAPSSKRRAAEVISGAGGRYVDVAVMAPVHPKLNLVPLLIAGPEATSAAPILEALPMSLRVVEGDVGAASTIKMLRSVIVKGLEALTAECALAAVAAGVEGEVMASLNTSHPGSDWDGQAVYNFERAMAHGARRAAEMEEVARTLSDLGLPNDMTRATVQWQRRIAGAGIRPPEDARSQGARVMAEMLLAKIRG